MVIKTVKRGYITEYNKEEFWDEELYLVPKGVELYDAHVAPYYIDYGEGEPLIECYNKISSTRFDTYRKGGPYEVEEDKQTFYNKIYVSMRKRQIRP